MNILKKSGAAAVERELANLATRRASLEARHAKATATLSSARAARKAALAGDVSVDLSASTSAVRDAMEELEAIESVLADAAEETVAAEARLAAAQDVEARGAAVKALGAYADKYDAAAAELDTALRQVSKAFAALVDAVPETLAVVDLDGRLIQADQLHRPGPAGLFTIQTSHATARPVDLARVLLAEGLAKVVPAAFPYSDALYGYRASLDRARDFSAARPTYHHSSLNSMIVAQTAKQAATELVTNRLRARAKAIAAGEAGPDLADRRPWVSAERAPEAESVPEVEIYATSNFSFQLKEGGHRTLCGSHWVHPIPADAASAAVKAGVALLTSTPQGAAAFKAQKEGRESGRIVGRNGDLHPDDCHSLGVIRATPDDDDV